MDIKEVQEESILCENCGKINTWETTTKGYYPSDYRYCNCGFPIEFDL